MAIRNAFNPFGGGNSFPWEMPNMNSPVQEGYVVTGSKANSFHVFNNNNGLRVGGYGYSMWINLVLPHKVEITNIRIRNGQQDRHGAGNISHISCAVSNGGTSITNWTTVSRGNYAETNIPVTAKIKTKNLYFYMDGDEYCAITQIFLEGKR